MTTPVSTNVDDCKKDSDDIVLCNANNISPERIQQLKKIVKSCNKLLNLMFKDTDKSAIDYVINVPLFRSFVKKTKEIGEFKKSDKDLSCTNQKYDFSCQKEDKNVFIKKDTIFVCNGFWDLDDYQLSSSMGDVVGGNLRQAFYQHTKFTFITTLVMVIQFPINKEHLQNTSPTEEETIDQLCHTVAEQSEESFTLKCFLFFISISNIFTTTKIIGTTGSRILISDETSSLITVLNYFQELSTVLNTLQKSTFNDLKDTWQTKYITNCQL